MMHTLHELDLMNDYARAHASGNDKRRWEAYLHMVELVESEGATRSDAQGVVDAWVDEIGLTNKRVPA